MSKYCPECFEKSDFLHKCGESSPTGFIGEDSSNTSTKNLLTPTVLAAPLVGVLLDFLLPLPSSLIVSTLVALLGSALTGFLWVAVKFDGYKSFRFFIKNLSNFIYTPNMLKIFNPDRNRKASSTWLSFVALSVAIQVFLFTPGNASFIENSISNKIDEKSGFSLKVQCPGTQIFLYQDEIKCRVRTGVLGISVPARVKLSPIVGTFTVKVSLL